MSQMDSTQLVIPITYALATCFTIVGAFISAILWTFSTFEKKEKISELKAELRQVELDSHKRHDDTAQQMDQIKSTVGKTASDVSFIRGWIEGNNGPKS